MIWLEVNADGLVTNAIRWDGKSLYEPPEGQTLHPWDEDAKPWIGWTLNADGSWSKPPEPEPPVE